MELLCFYAKESHFICRQNALFLAQKTPEQEETNAQTALPAVHCLQARPSAFLLLFDSENAVKDHSCLLSL